MSFYLINKTIRSDAGIVISKHDDFDGAQAADSALQKKARDDFGSHASIPVVIIESDKELEPGAVVTAGDY